MKISASILIASVALAAATQASAATVVRSYYSHGSASCQSALPTFDVNIRKRPMAVANEGTATAFVTCDTESNASSGPGPVEIRVGLSNLAGSDDAVVGCTMVTGYIGGQYFVPKSEPLPNGQVTTIIWTREELNDENLQFSPALSCALPPGVSIHAVTLVYEEDVGP